jgi:hypothetical protein
MALIGSSACSSSQAPAPTGKVQFFLDAPFCSLQMPMQFYIDHRLLGSDTLRVNFAPDDTMSQVFEAPVGFHTFGARGTFPPPTAVYIWPDTTVFLAPGQVLIDTLPLYCS